MYKSSETFFFFLSGIASLKKVLEDEFHKELTHKDVEERK